MVRGAVCPIAGWLAMITGVKAKLYEVFSENPRPLSAAELWEVAEVRTLLLLTRIKRYLYFHHALSSACMLPPPNDGRMMPLCCLLCFTCAPRNDLRMRLQYAQMHTSPVPIPGEVMAHAF